MEGSILKDLDFSTVEEFEEKRKVLIKNKERLETYLILWIAIGLIGALVIYSSPPAPLIAICAFAIPVISCANKMAEYGSAIEGIEASAKEAGVL